MSEENKLKLYALQETCRFSADDLDLIHDLYEQVIGDIKKIPVGRLIPMLFVKASQVSGQKVVPDLKVIAQRDELLTKLEELQNVANDNARSSTGLQLEIDRLTKLNEQLEDNNRVLRESAEGCIIIQFEDKAKNYFSNLLEILKWKKKAHTYEEMFVFIFQTLNNSGWFKLESEDIEYLNG